MGTKGAKNTPITARINAGLFNQKGGVTEPILNVGPAGVYGNNQTRDIPSPSKLRGYSMKSSPFKQENTTNPELEENKEPKSNDQVIADASTGDISVMKTTPGTKGTEGTSVNTDDYDGSGGYEDPEKWAAWLKTDDGKAYTKKHTKIIPGEKGTPDKNSLEGKFGRTEGDAQYAIDRRNTLRGGKAMNRGDKVASVKDARNTWKGMSDKEKIAAGGSRRDYMKKKKTDAKGEQNKANKLLAQTLSANVQRQAEQNRSPGSDKSVNEVRNLNQGLDTTKGAQEELADTTLATKKTPGFFKKKSPMKAKYFK